MDGTPHKVMTNPEVGDAILKMENGPPPPPSNGSAGATPNLGNSTTTTPANTPKRTQQKPSILRRPCMYLTRFVKSLPVMFIFLVVGWSYYAYIVAVVMTAMDHVAEQVICAIVYHILFILFVSSYWMSIFTPPGSCPPSWVLPQQSVTALAAAQSEQEWKLLLNELAGQMQCPVKQRSVQNAVRYCEKCCCIKPDRSHHCSVCDACTLKMDHHCPWINNCVGFGNYKFFMLFLGYALLYCLFIAATSLQYFIQFWVQSQDFGPAKYHILFVFFVSIMFSLSVSSLFWYHVWLTLHNRSTLEQFRGPVFEDGRSDPQGWSLGKLNNFREVFGPNHWLWFVPIQTHLGDGIVFPTRGHTNYHSIGEAPTVVRVETPPRTLINPVLCKDGKDQAVVPTEVVLDNNGHAHTIMVNAKNDIIATPDTEVTELVAK